MIKTITLDGKQMTMKASAKVPRIYRTTFNRDMLIDMQELIEGYNAKMQKNTNLPPEILTIFENVAWVFLKEGGEQVGNSPDEWLENLDGMFSIYEVLPEIVELWVDANKTTSTPSR